MAILRTDAVVPQFADRHGDYPDMFGALLTRSAAAVPVGLTVESHDVRVADYPAPGDFHGYVITGSRNSVYDDEAWIAELAEFVREVLGAGRKVIGVCFGHQLLAHFFGGETRAADNGWAVGVQESRVVSREPWMTPEGSRVNLIASHKDQVARLPDGARLIISGAFCPIGGFVMGDQVLTMQGHPEFQREYSRDLMDMRRELLGEATYRAGIESLDKETDEDRVGRWMINFLLGCGQ